MKNLNGQVHCSFISFILNPIKSTMSIPRLELMAAVLSAKVGSRIRNGFDIPVHEEA